MGHESKKWKPKSQTGSKSTGVFRFCQGRGGVPERPGKYGGGRKLEEGRKKKEEEEIRKTKEGRRRKQEKE